MNALRENRQAITKTRGAKNRGAVLVTSLACVLLLVTLGSALLVNMLGGMHLAKHVEFSSLAFNVAESGGERALRWLKDQSAPPAGTSTLSPFGGAQSLGAGTYTVTVTPFATNSGAILKSYKILSVGTIYGATETIEIVARQQSFGKYAYFTDSEVSSITGGAIWFFRFDKIRGPAHSNNAGGSNFQINYNGSTQSIFDDMVTAAGPSMNYNPGSPTTEADFLKVYKNGSRGYQLNVDPIPMPASSDAQRDAGWGSTSGFPGTDGVYVPASGGIYVKGDSTVAMSVVSGNQVFTIGQGSTSTKVTVNLTNNTRSVQVGSGAITTIAGAGTGVLYSNGNITSLAGTIGDNKLSSSPVSITARNAYTIAADTNAGKNITVTGNIVYQSAPNPALPINDIVNLTPGTLGLIARNVTMSTSCPTNLEIDAQILAGSSSTTNGSFSAASYDTRAVGTLKIVGGIIQKARGPVGTFNGSTGAIVSGFAKNYWYDPRLADYPPPYFPTTGLYDRLSWRKMR